MSVPILALDKVSKRFGAIVFFLLRQTLSDLGSIYLLMLGAVAIAIMLTAPKGLWGLIAERFGFSVFPLERRVVLDGSTAARAVRAGPDGR